MLSAESYQTIVAEDWPEMRNLLALSSKPEGSAHVA